MMIIIMIMITKIIRRRRKKNEATNDTHNTGMIEVIMICMASGHHTP